MKPSNYSDKALAQLNTFSGFSEKELKDFVSDFGPFLAANPHSLLSSPPTSNPSIPNPSTTTNSSPRVPVKPSATNVLLHEATLNDQIERVRTKGLLLEISEELGTNHPSPRHTSTSPSHSLQQSAGTPLHDTHTANRPDSQTARRSRKSTLVVKRVSHRRRDGLGSKSRDGSSAPVSDREAEDARATHRPRSLSTDHTPERRRSASKSRTRRLVKAEEDKAILAKPTKGRKLRGASRGQASTEKYGSISKRARRPRSMKDEDKEALVTPSKKSTPNHRSGVPGPRGSRGGDPGGSVPSDSVVEAVHIPHSRDLKEKETNPDKRSKAASARSTPKERILDFARNGTYTLSKLDKQRGEAQVRKRCSLATFAGCESFEKVSLASYFRALCVLHKDAVEFAALGNQAQDDRGIDNLVCDVNEEGFAKAMTEGEERAGIRRENHGPVPPFIERTLDVLQLIFRLWQKMCAGDEDIMEGFMKSIYGQGAVRAIADLSTSVLKLWQKRNTSTEREYARGDVVEYAIRMMANIFNFELSPVSIIPTSIKLSDMGIREKDENFSLPQLLDVVLDYVGHEAVATRECRLAASDICHIYFARHHFGFPQKDENGKAWETIFKSNVGHIQSVIQHKAFWPIIVHTAIQTVKKNQLGRDHKVAVVFLVSLLSEPAASRSLLESQTKVRHALLDVFVKTLDRLGRDLIRYVRESEYGRISHPDLPTVLDLVRRLMSFAVVQREVVSSRELGGREKFLGAIENVITKASKLVQGNFDTAKLVAAAQSRGLGKLGDDLQRALSVQSGGLYQGGTESESEAPHTIKLTGVAAHRSLAFAAWLIGSLGKSMEDGSRDMSQMNGLQVLLSSKYNNTRGLRRLWTDVIKIQSCVEEKFPQSVQEIGGSTEMLYLSTEELLSEHDRNHFSMVVEKIRQRLASEMKERRSRSSPLSPKQSLNVARVDSALDTKAGPKISFPDVSKVKDLRAAVCLPKGHQDLDDDPQMLAHLEKVMRCEAEDVLSRYDVESDIMFQWVRLQKKNAYVGNARELLDKADRILGHPCSCLPGNPTESGNGNQNHIACANDVCENRSTKVECVPGECGAGSYCQNQRLQRQEYAKVKIQNFPGKGLGVVANEEISAGTFIGEYQGEVISKDLFEERRKMYKGEKHFYFMTLTGKLVIDASRKSQFTRFVNHSCDPNAETHKWNAGGEPRVGIFAIRKIAKGEEITFDYGARSLDNDSVPCLCGASKCRGVLTRKKENVDDKDVPTSGSSLANPERALKNDAAAAEKKREAEIEEREKLEAMLKEKIEKAKKRLKFATELKEQKSEAEEKRRLLDESSLTQQMKSRLSEWESSLRKTKEKPKTMFSLNDESSSKPEARVRIPRRPPLSILITHAAHLKKQEEEEIAARSSKVTSKRPAPQASRKPEHPQAWYERFGNSANRMNASQGSATVPDRAGSQVMAGASTRPTKNGPQAPKKTLPVFAPTSTKFTKPLLKPKTAERKRKRKRDDEDSDSLDGYSTASSVEPILEEPELSDIPDGLGACSDDEFVAAPPIIPEPESRESARRDGSYREQGHGDSRERRDVEGRGQGHRLDGVNHGGNEGHRSPHLRNDFRNGPHIASRTGNGAHGRYVHDSHRRSPPPQERFYRNHGRSGYEGAAVSPGRHDRNLGRSGYMTERSRDFGHRPRQDIAWSRDTRNEPIRGTNYRKTLAPNPESRQPRGDDKVHKLESNSFPRHELPTSGSRGDTVRTLNVRTHAKEDSAQDNRKEQPPHISAGNKVAGDPLRIAALKEDDPRQERGVAKTESEGIQKHHPGYEPDGPDKRKALDMAIDGKQKQVNQSSLSKVGQNRIATNDVKPELSEPEGEQKSQGKAILAPQPDTGGVKSNSRAGSNGIERGLAHRSTATFPASSSDIGQRGFEDENRKGAPLKGYNADAAGRQERSGSPMKRRGIYTSRFEKRVDVEESGRKRARDDNDRVEERWKRHRGGDESLEVSGGRYGRVHEHAPGRGSGVLDRVGWRPTDGTEVEARRQLDDLRRSSSGGGYGRTWSGEQGGNRQRMPFRAERWSPRWDGRKEKRSPNHDRGYPRYSRLGDLYPQGRRSGEVRGFDRRGNMDYVPGPVGQRDEQQRRGQGDERGGKDLRRLIQKRSR